MIPDYPLEETIDFKFTSRAFATGIPTVLAGTPVVEIYEDNSITQITAAETLTVDFDSVVGLNNLRVVATAANGFEAGKSYHCVLSAGTVGGVSVVGEVVAQFSIQRSPVNWANVTAPTTANDLSATDIQLCDTITTYTGNTVQTGDTFALANGTEGFVAIDTVVDAIKVITDQFVFTVANQVDSRALTAAPAVNSGIYEYFTLGSNEDPFKADVTALATTAELDKVPKSDGTVSWNSTALAAINAEADTAFATWAPPTKAEMDTAHALLATPAQVNTEVVDALNVDTYAEPGQGTPAATASLATKIGYLFKNWRNKKTQTATTWSLMNDDATTVDQKATVADDATTASKTEITTGP